MTPSSHTIAFTLNGDPVEANIEAHVLLIDLLRNAFAMNGVKRSCDMEICGACTVLVDEQPVSSCTMLAVDVDGTTVLTIEGLGGPENMDPIQKAFIEHGAVQCGFCTPGFILATKAFLRVTPKPSREEIVHQLNGNICRCAGYKKIIEAVQSLV